MNAEQKLGEPGGVITDTLPPSSISSSCASDTVDGGGEGVCSCSTAGEEGTGGGGGGGGGRGSSARVEEGVRVEGWAEDGCERESLLVTECLLVECSSSKDHEY